MMAPRSSHKKHVKFAKSRSPIPRKKIKTTSADSYANIVLHYLSKLKGLFQSPRSHYKGISSYFGRESYDNITKPILKKDSVKNDSDAESKQKVYDIVLAALQYGCQNNIIEKVGNYFLVKTSDAPKISTRRPTPGPDYIRCASCKNLSKYSDRRRSVSSIKSRDYHSKHKRNRSYDDDDSDYVSSSRRRRSRSNTSVVNYCPKCYVRLKSSKKN